MPLVALAVIAYAAGLALGFGGVVHLTAASVGCAGIVGIVARDARPVALAAFAVAGALAARGTALDEERCARTRGPIVAAFAEPLAPPRRKLPRTAQVTEKIGGPGRTRTCNQIVMSDRL